MQSKQKEDSELHYEIFEDKRVIRFLDKHINDNDLQDRIEDKYYWLSINPYKEAEKSFKSHKCPKCKKTRIGGYRLIYFIHEPTKEIEIIDIGLRKNIYKKWD